MIDKDLLKNLNTEQKQALLEQLMSSLSEASVEEKPKQLEQDVPAKGGVNEDFTVTRDINESKRNVPVRAKKNKWVDTGEIDQEVDEYSSDRKRTSRTRGKTKKVQLECSVCGKTYMEHPSIVYGEYHRCNRCGGR